MPALRELHREVTVVSIPLGFSDTETSAGIAFYWASVIDRSDSSGRSGGLLQRSPRVVRRGWRDEPAFGVLRLVYSVKADSKVLQKPPKFRFNNPCGQGTGIKPGR